METGSHYYKNSNSILTTGYWKRREGGRDIPADPGMSFRQKDWSGCSGSLGLGIFNFTPHSLLAWQQKPPESVGFEWPWGTQGVLCAMHHMPGELSRCETVPGHQHGEGSSLPRRAQPNAAICPPPAGANSQVSTERHLRCSSAADELRSAFPCLPLFSFTFPAQLSVLEKEK